MEEGICKYIEDWAKALDPKTAYRKAFEYYKAEERTKCYQCFAWAARDPRQEERILRLQQALWKKNNPELGQLKNVLALAVHMNDNWNNLPEGRLAQIDLCLATGRRNLAQQKLSDLIEIFSNAPSYCVYVERARRLLAENFPDAERTLALTA